VSHGLQADREEVETKNHRMKRFHVGVQLAIIAEGVGTATLVAIVIGSGVMGETLAQGNAAVTLLANALATGAGLFVLITLLGPISGAHFNPLVTGVLWWKGRCTFNEFCAYVIAQIVGAIAGVCLAHLMFDLPVFELGTKVRSGTGLWISEVVATSGLLATILLGLRSAPRSIPALVGSYIFAAYWFTSSTSFANPAVTIARSLTNTFAGIRSSDAPAFIAAQIVGAFLVIAASRRLRNPIVDVA
jgi:glycerol uptake facilitator-like aquaporin